MDELIKKLQSIEKDYGWSIGCSLHTKYECRIYERKIFRDRKRVVVIEGGVSFEDAVEKALKRIAQTAK